MACGSDFCIIPCLRCDCQESCHWLRIYGEVYQTCLDECDGNPTCKNACGDTADDDLETCLSDCTDDQPEALVPEIPSVVEWMQFDSSSGWPDFPAHFYPPPDSGDFFDCNTDCLTHAGESRAECDEEYDSCIDLGGDHDGCVEDRDGCYETYFQDLADCFTSCLVENQVFNRDSYQRVDGYTTHCQHAKGLSLFDPPGDDLFTSLSPDGSETCSRCLREAARDHFNNLWPQITATAAAVRACVQTRGDCEPDVGGTCFQDEWGCLNEVKAAWYRSIQMETIAYGERRAQCLAVWHRSTYRPWAGAPSESYPLQKVIACHSDLYYAFPMTVPETDPDKIKGWLRNDLEWNARDLECQAELCDCIGPLDPFEYAGDYTPDGITPLGLCNRAAFLCHADLNRQRIEAKVRTARLCVPRLPKYVGTAAIITDDPLYNSLHPWALTHPHDHNRSWCVAQTTALANDCAALLLQEQDACLVSCCGDDSAGCFEDCAALDFSGSSGSHDCLDAFVECVKLYDPRSLDFARDGRAHCYEVLRDCILTGDPSACKKEILHYADDFVCEEHMPDCPYVLDDVLGSEIHPACLTKDIWQWHIQYVSVFDFPCD